MISGATFVPTQRLTAVSTMPPATTATPAAPATAGENEFSASYAPQIYAVYLNGFIANASVASTSLATDLFSIDVAQPPIAGDQPAVIPGLPPVSPIPGAEGTRQVAAAVGRLAGTGKIFSSAPPARAHAAAKKAA